MRLTHAQLQVALAFLARPADRQWGYDLSKQAAVRSGVLYPMLTRMLTAGWLTDGWEDPTTLETKRPPRRYYTLTEGGKLALGALVTRARSDTRFRNLDLGST